MFRLFSSTMRSCSARGLSGTECVTSLIYLQGDWLFIRLHLGWWGWLQPFSTRTRTKHHQNNVLLPPEENMHQINQTLMWIRLFVGVNGPPAPLTLTAWLLLRAELWLAACLALRLLIGWFVRVACFSFSFLISPSSRQPVMRSRRRLKPTLTSLPVLTLKTWILKKKNLDLVRKQHHNRYCLNLRRIVSFYRGSVRFEQNRVRSADSCWL